MNATQNEFVARIEAARGAAVKLTVYRIPPDMATLVAVSPAALESFPDVSIDEIGDGATIGSALDALVATAPEASKRPIDARYGLVFEDASGERILSAYKGAFATRGQIGADPVDYTTLDFHQWLVARYPLRAATEE